MTENPRVSVIMSVYNGERFLRESIDSIIQQTFADFEFIIFNDASTDGSLAIIKSYHDPRIKLINNETNLGLTRNLNTGIGLTKGEFIARQDADDVSLPDRFAEQVRYFETHPETVLLGTGIYLIDTNGAITGKRSLPEDPSRNSFKGSFFAHGSVMFRRQPVRELNGYNELFRYCQDYELWLRIARRYQVRGLPELLYKLRYHEENVQFTKREEAALYHLLALRIDRNALDEKLERTLRRDGIKAFYPFLNRQEKIYYLKASATKKMRSNESKLARSEYWQIFRLRPFDIRNDFNLALSYLGKWPWAVAHRLYEKLWFR